LFGVLCELKQALYVEATSDFHEVWCRGIFMKFGVEVSYTEKLSGKREFREN
jgi:hypothetical protein